MVIPQKRFPLRITTESSKSTFGWNFINQRHQARAQDTCASMLTAAFFIRVKRWKQTKYPSMDKWTSKMWYAHTLNTMEYMQPLKEGNSDTRYKMGEA